MNTFRKSITTLNIESNSIRLLQIKGKRVEKYGETALTSGLMEQGLITNPEAVAGKLNDLVKELDISRRNVLVSMNCFRSVTRFITLPGMRETKLKEAVRWAAEREMPVSLDSLNIWWKTIEKNTLEQKVLVIGVPRDALVALYKTLFYAHITPRAIDVKAIVLSRIAAGGTAVIADIENDTISIIIKSGGIPVMMRSIMINPDNNLMEDRILKLKDEMLRLVTSYNNSEVINRIRDEDPVYLSGGLSEAGFFETFEEITGRTICLPDTDLVAPEGFSYGRFAVNIGLYMRELKSRRSMLYPDMSRAVRFKV